MKKSEYIGRIPEKTPELGEAVPFLKQVIGIAVIVCAVFVAGHFALRQLAGLEQAKAVLESVRVFCAIAAGVSILSISNRLRSGTNSWLAAAAFVLLAVSFAGLLFTLSTDGPRFGFHAGWSLGLILTLLAALLLLSGFSALAFSKGSIRLDVPAVALLVGVPLMAYGSGEHWFQVASQTIWNVLSSTAFTTLPFWSLGVGVFMAVRPAGSRSIETGAFRTGKFFAIPAGSCWMPYAFVTLFVGLVCGLRLAEVWVVLLAPWLLLVSVRLFFRADSPASGDQGMARSVFWPVVDWPQLFVRVLGLVVVLLVVRGLARPVESVAFGLTACLVAGPMLWGPRRAWQVTREGIESGVSIFAIATLWLIAGVVTVTVLNRLGIPDQLSNVLQSISAPPTAVAIAVAIVFLLAGRWLPSGAPVLVLVPIAAFVLSDAGYSDVWSAAFIILVLFFTCEVEQTIEHANKRRYGLLVAQVLVLFTMMAWPELCARPALLVRYW